VLEHGRTDFTSPEPCHVRTTPTRCRFGLRLWNFTKSTLPLMAANS
jgi:hypothetical protein